MEEMDIPQGRGLKIRTGKQGLQTGDVVAHTCSSNY
jgi:hypothetical protein